MRISYWSADVCSSDLPPVVVRRLPLRPRPRPPRRRGTGIATTATTTSPRRRGAPPTDRPMAPPAAAPTDPPTPAAPTDRPMAPRAAPTAKIGRAHVCTPVTNAHLVCRLLLEKKKTSKET